MVAHQDFYDKFLKQQYEGAKVSPTIMATILDLFQSEQQVKADESVEGQSSSDKLWQILSVAREAGGFDVMTEDTPFIEWFRDRLVTLAKYQDHEMMTSEAPPTRMPGADFSLYSDLTIYTQEGQTTQSARRLAGKEREMHGPNTRVFFCAHQPGEPCVSQCKEVPFND